MSHYNTTQSIHNLEVIIHNLAVRVCGIGIICNSQAKSQDCACVLQPLAITLKGITNAPADPSVDVWRTVTLPLLRQATGLSDGFELKIVKRGAEPAV